LDYGSGALPLKKWNQLEFTNFICTARTLSAMEMLPTIVDDLVRLEEGVEMVNTKGNPVLVVAPLQFITADNARHSELKSSKGAVSLRLCRKYDCEAVVERIYKAFQESGCTDCELLDDKQAGYKLVGGQALLRLKAFNTMTDTPIELLNTIMLGVGKSLFKDLVVSKHHFNEDQKRKLQNLLLKYKSPAFHYNLRTALNYCQSFLGRDYKIVLQELPLLLDKMIGDEDIIQLSPGIAEIKTCFDHFGKLVSLVYVSNISCNAAAYVELIRYQYGQLRYSVSKYNAYTKTISPKNKNGRPKLLLYNSSKLHILHHLPQDILRFGSAMFFETEKGEQYNKFIREALFRTNRQNPSKDVAISFGKRFMLRHVLTGGSWRDSNESWKNTMPKVLSSRTSFNVHNPRDFADNDQVDSEDIDLKLGHTGLVQLVDGSLFVGEVVGLDPSSDFTSICPYSFLCTNAEQSASTFAPQRYLEPASDLQRNLVITCLLMNISVNILLQKAKNDIQVLRKQNVKMIALLDVSQTLQDQQIR
ncbi:hypothetical protein MBANPS3_012495, partial [Mucor bainieri]